MLKINSLRKFLIKARVQLLILGLIVICIITVAGNASLAVNKALMEKILGYMDNYEEQETDIFKYDEWLQGVIGPYLV